MEVIVELGGRRDQVGRILGGRMSSGEGKKSCDEKEKHFRYVKLVRIRDYVWMANNLTIAILCSPYEGVYRSPLYRNPTDR